MPRDRRRSKPKARSSVKSTRSFRRTGGERTEDTRAQPREGDRPGVRVDVQFGDVLLLRTATGGFRRDSTRAVYRIRIHGIGTLPQVFSGFDQAVVEGDRIASGRKVCLFYLESADAAPHFLGNFRTRPAK